MYPRLVPFGLILAGLLVLPDGRADEWVAAGTEGCQVSVPGPTAETLFRWQGVCAEGKVQGTGVLTSSRGGLLRGEFRAGLPFNTYGFWPLQFKDGGLVMAGHGATDGLSMWNDLELPDDQGKATPANVGPLTGDWDFLSGNGKCRERHTFRADGTFTVTSGKEVMEGAYAVMAIANASGVLGLLKSDIAGNGQRDCSGHRSPKAPDRTNFFYLAVQSPDRIDICRVSKSPLTCVGTFTRVVE